MIFNNVEGFYEWIKLICHKALAFVVINILKWSKLHT